MAVGAKTDALTAVVRNRIAEPTAKLWLDDDIWAYLSAAQIELCQRLCDAALAPTMSDGVSTALIGAQTNYSLESDLLRIRLVKYKGIVARRWPVKGLDALRKNPLTAPTETNPFYYIWNDEIHFPFTVTQAGTEAFEMWYIKKPGALEGVAGGTAADPTVSAHTYGLMETFAVARCREQGETYQQAEVQMAHFVEECQMINSRFMGKDAFDGIPGDPILQPVGE